MKSEIVGQRPTITGGNNFLYNAGSELNKTTSNYEMFFREYDPALGRMMSVDPVAGKYSSLTPYNYAFNDPVTYNDPLGDDASDRNYGKFSYFNGSADFSPQDAHAGPGSGGMFGSAFIRYGPGNSILMGYLDKMWADTEDVKSNKLSIEAYAGLSSLMPNQVFNVWAGKQKASGGYRGAWQTYSSTIRDLVEERGYKLRLRYEATNIPKDGYGPYRWDYGYQFDKATIMFFQWAFGLGPTDRTFNDDRITKAMKDAAGVNNARNYFYSEVNAGRKKITDGVTNYGASFGLKGLWQAGTDPIEQFVGSYNVNIASDGNLLTFTLTNTTSMTSILYGFGPSWSRSSWSPGGNMTQTFIWTESIDCTKLSPK